MVATIKQFSENIDFYLSSVVKQDRELIIDSINGNAVLVSEDNWNQLNETVKLLGDKISMKLPAASSGVSH
jgi:PHD/YefM family antitoxin component YafN of YafNO toxin-antitoxin module